MADDAATFRQVATVFAPVGDQERALAFYVEGLGFEKRADFEYGGGLRWVEVAPPESGIAIALVPAGEGAPSRHGEALCALTSTDIGAHRARLSELGVEVDAEIGGNGRARPGLISRSEDIPDPVPAQFCFCDPDGNRFLVVQPD